MCRVLYVLVLLMYVGLAHSWDIAVGVGNQLIFYTDGTRSKTVNFISQNVAALAYDQVHNRMIYVNKQSNNDAICSYDMSSRENKCFVKRPGSNIQSIAFDPATQTLFFTDANDNSISWVSLKFGSVNNVYENLLIKMDDRTPSDISVDSCRGYIYWIDKNNKNNKASIERARFNGSKREILNKRNEEFDVLSLAIDELTGEVYYFDGIRVGNSYKDEYLNSADFNGQDYIIYGNSYGGPMSAPKELTLSKDYIYWVNGSEGYWTVWQKKVIQDKEVKNISTFHTEKSLAIAINYKLKYQILGLQDCANLSSLIPTITVTNNSLNIEQTTEYTTDVELFCVHGVHVNETSVCNCTPGYIGERCEVSVCHNYCLQGNCSLNDEGLPTCRCNAGYSGKRCELYACFGYCWNGGDCSLNEEDEPVCQCAAKHEGSRCETDTSDTATPTYDLPKGNLTLADLLLRWRKPTSKMFLTVEV